MNANILVIDSDKLVVQLLEKALGKAGHQVTAVDEPNRGLRLLDEQSYDLVITDIAMRNMTGIQVLEQVKALDDTIEVVVFAGAEEESFENALAALRLGASDFLTKPLRNMDELMAAVERALEKRSLSKNIRNLAQSVAQMRSIDFLTGLSTRRYFLERVSIELRRARRHKKNVSCLMVDVDHLEQINRDYGRPCGDQALIYVAQAVSHDRRITDILARYGGEEFVLVLPETRSDQAMTAAEKIRQRVESGQFSFGGQVIPVTISIGVSGAQAPESITELLQQAQQALTEAKRGGRNCVRAVGVAVEG
jgi:two-component system cell cycle response regulator